MKQARTFAKILLNLPNLEGDTSTCAASTARRRPTGIIRRNHRSLSNGTHKTIDKKFKKV